MVVAGARHHRDLEVNKDMLCVCASGTKLTVRVCWNYIVVEASMPCSILGQFQQILCFHRCPFLHRYFFLYRYSLRLALIHTPRFRIGHAPQNSVFKKPGLLHQHVSPSANLTSETDIPKPSPPSESDQQYP